MCRLIGRLTIIMATRKQSAVSPDSQPKNLVMVNRIAASNRFMGSQGEVFFDGPGVKKTFSRIANTNRPK